MLCSDFEPLMPVHRLSEKSQFSADNVVSRGNAASLFPICVHYLERQLIKEAAVVLSAEMRSEMLITLLLNFTTLSVGDC
jgi:hypothetical protein